MMNSKSTNTRYVIRKLIFTQAMLLALSFVVGCSANRGEVKLNPKNPVTITVWHYYNGAIMNAFNELVDEFNETVGVEKGIIVEGSGHGNVAELEKEVLSSANREIGSKEMPNIFASYADTAYEAEKLGLLADLDKFLSEEDQSEYLDSYIEEGKIGINGELRIFPIAKSTEIMMVNETDWLPFAKDNGLTYDDLQTLEGITRVSKLYYEWTDAQTPESPNDGKSFFGRDSMANLFIIASKEFGTELFEVNNGTAKINVNSMVMRKLWDNYYLPYISGYFSAYGRYRSDDAKVGDIIAYVGSTSSASYFPNEVTVKDRVYEITAKILPAPRFEGAQRVLVQQGAGMVVTKSTDEKEYASAVFLRWFTQTQNNINFAALSGYMPVKKEAIDYDLLKSAFSEKGLSIDPITDETLRISLEEISISEMYTNKAFDGGTIARSILEYDLQDKAVADREAVLQMIENGINHAQAVGKLDTEDNFNLWIEELTQKLNEATK